MAWRIMVRLLLGCVCLVVAATGHAQWHERSADAMGTRIRVELWHPDAQLAAQALDAVMAEIV